MRACSSDTCCHEYGCSASVGTSKQCLCSTSVSRLTICFAKSFSFTITRDGRLADMSPRPPSRVDTQIRPAARDSITFKELPQTFLAGLTVIEQPWSNG